MKRLRWTILCAIVLWHGKIALADDNDEIIPHDDTTDQAKPANPESSDDTPAADDAAKAKAKEVLEAYLSAVKAKKWADARKFIHPKALADIAEIKKRTGQESHGLATWARAVSDAYLTDYQLGAPTATAKGAVTVSSTEEEFDVQEKGTEPGVKAEYLLIPLAGKWFVADRRSGDGELFPPKSLALSYKGYFNGEYVAPPPSEEPPPKAKTKKRKHHKSDDEE